MRQVFRQQQQALRRFVPALESSNVVVYSDDSGLWHWRKLSATGAITRSSASGFATRDEATEAAYESNPGTPVQVEVFSRSRSA
jgi:hypothetical protein